MKVQDRELWISTCLGRALISSPRAIQPSPADLRRLVRGWKDKHFQHMEKAAELRCLHYLGMKKSL